MSLTEEEQDMIIHEAVDSLYLDIILPGVLTRDELIEKIIELLTEKGI